RAVPRACAALAETPRAGAPAGALPGAWYRAEAESGLSPRAWRAGPRGCDALAARAAIPGAQPAAVARGVPGRPYRGVHRWPASTPRLRTAAAKSAAGLCGDVRRSTEG